MQNKIKKFGRDIAIANSLLGIVERSYNAIYPYETIFDEDDTRQLIKTLKDYIRIKNDTIKVLNVLKEVDKKCCGK